MKIEVDDDLKGIFEGFQASQIWKGFGGEGCEDSWKKSGKSKKSDTDEPKKKRVLLS
jgi:hypothetical protein